MDPDKCQFASLHSMGAGNAKVPIKFYIIKLGKFVKRHLSGRKFAVVYKLYFILMYRKKPNSSSKPDNKAQTRRVINDMIQPLKAGDLVRVRSIEEIEATLDEKGKTKGCGFIPIQHTYCGTVQRVFKSVERFVDERDFKVKKGRGLVLLEGLICEGVEVFGRCDRACLLFWREEWLDKIADSDLR